MREFFENLQLSFYLPKLNAIQNYLDNIIKTRLASNPLSSAEYLDGLTAFAEKSEENSRSLILQGELVWMIVVLEKSSDCQIELNLKDPRISRVLPTLKFSINLSKHDKTLNSEKIISLNARFLESQVFIDEKEQAILQETDNNTGEEAPLFYETNFDKNQVVYLLRIPVCKGTLFVRENNYYIAIHQEYLDAYLNMRVSLISPLEQVRAIGEPEDVTFGGILNKIYETLNANKDKKPYVLYQAKTIKVTNIFDCQSTIDTFGKKVFITLKMKNKLNEVQLEDKSGGQENADKLKLYIENVDFLLQTSVSKTQFDLSDREKIAPEVNEAFSYKILGGRMPIVLNEDSEFNLLIQVDKEKDFVRSDSKYLIYQCDECKKNPQIPNDSFVVYTEKIDEIERAPKTPTINPFSNRNESLSFKEVLGGGDRSPSLDRSPPATSRSKFDFNFFQSPMNFENKSIKSTGVGSLEALSSPSRSYPTNIKNIVFEKKKEGSPTKSQKQTLELHENATSSCKCFKLKDSGISVYMSTPLIIKWSINHLFFTSSIYRIVWNFKDVDIINVASRIVSHYYKVKDVIEIEVEVENQSLNDMDLELIPPSEVLQHLSSDQEPTSLELVGPHENHNERFNLNKMEKAINRKIKNDQLMAIATEKSIPYGVLKPKDKKKMKMNLLTLNHGTVKIDYLIFYDKQKNIYLKVQVPLSFIVS